jgi:hypothetical protein
MVQLYCSISPGGPAILFPSKLDKFVNEIKKLISNVLRIRWLSVTRLPVALALSEEWVKAISPQQTSCVRKSCVRICLCHLPPAFSAVSKTKTRSKQTIITRGRNLSVVSVQIGLSGTPDVRSGVSKVPFYLIVNPENYLKHRATEQLSKV